MIMEINDLNVVPVSVQKRSASVFVDLHAAPSALLFRSSLQAVEVVFHDYFGIFRSPHVVDYGFWNLGDVSKRI